MNEGNLLPGMIASLMMLSIGFLFLHGINFQKQDPKETQYLGGAFGSLKVRISCHCQHQAQSLAHCIYPQNIKAFSVPENSTIIAEHKTFDNVRDERPRRSARKPDLKRSA